MLYNKYFNQLDEYIFHENINFKWKKHNWNEKYDELNKLLDEPISNFIIMLHFNSYV